ncbi:MAG: cation:proton antiporter [Promethearchaeota archaeon]
MALDFAILVIVFAAVIVAIVFISGILSQLTRLPRLIFYLVAGLLIGPIGLGLITPGLVLALEGSLLKAVVGLAVAIIVFEGGYTFNRCLPHKKACTMVSYRLVLSRLLRLSLIGGLITGVLMTLLFHFVVLLPIEYAALCGVLCIITGPTVINPCVRQLRIKEEVGVALEGEGLLNDAVGVIVASVIFGWILAESLGGFIVLPLQIGLNLGLGVLVGLMVGGLGILVARFIAPRFLERAGHRCDEANRLQLTRIGTLIAAFLAYSLGEIVAPEAGIVSVLLAGILIGNRHYFGRDYVNDVEGLNDHLEAGVHAFQSDLTRIAIAAVFILLTSILTLELLADTLIFAPIPFAGLIVVGALMLLVRPVAVLISTIRAGFTLRERLFMSFFGPRGIVIAATAVFVYIELLSYGIDIPLIPGYIFLIAFATVVFQAGLAPLLARLFEVTTPKTQNEGAPDA